MIASNKRNLTAFAATAVLAMGLYGCGGGGGDGPVTGGGTTMPEGDTPQPHVTGWRNNSTAEDLLDHWNDPEALRSILSLSPVSQADVDSRKTLITELIDAAGTDPATSGTVLRNVDPDDVEIIGERDGITYGQWNGGPAGTLNVEFDWQFAPNISSSVRAQTERAGKFWSRRLLDNFGTHTVAAGTEIYHEGEHSGAESSTITYTEDVDVDGMIIAVHHLTMDEHSSAGPQDAEITENDYEPWLGSMALSQINMDERQTIGNWWFVFVLGHEIGHVLGFADFQGSWDVPSVERHINRQDATFEGPEAQRANDGNPVPFQWLDSERNAVPPNTPGSTLDYGHLGVCSSIMAYCANPREVYEPSELDFAYLDDIGYDILDAGTASEPELYGYGAWAQYSAWGAGVERTLEYVDDGLEVIARDQLRAGADAFGMAPSMTLAELHTPQSLGSATWTGSLIGVDLGSANLPPVFGDAELGVDLATLDGTAQFDNLTVHDDGEAVDFRSPSLMYDIEVTENSFADADGHVAGSFFGPAHEEMAGILNDQSSGVELLAGFGGTR